MLELTIESREYYDEKTNTFFTPDAIKKDVKLRLEHSLVSISKWESKWKKPFLTKDDKSYEEIVDYVKCMTLTQNVNPEVYKYLTVGNIQKVNSYIEDSMSATTFYEVKQYAKNNEQVTSELIYYWMIAFNIPMECQKWHLNRLMNLIRICSIKNASGSSKKMSKQEILARNRELNASRRAKLNTKG